MNTLLTISKITREAMLVLENMLTFTKLVDRQYDPQFAQGGAKIGDTCRVRKPPKYLGRDGQAMQIEDSTESEVPLKVTFQSGCDIQFSSADLALSIDDFRKRFIEPAIVTVANKIDRRGLELYAKVANAVGVPGTVPANLSTYIDAGVKLKDNAAPMDGRWSAVLNPRMEGTLVNALAGQFNPTTVISDLFTKGTMGKAAGFNFAMDQNVVAHTVGPLGGTPLVNGANQSGASIVTDAWTAAAALRVKVGDVITFTGVNGVNPQNRQSTGVLAQFVVTADCYSDGSGNLTLQLDPPLVASGAYQNVTNLPADNTPIQINGHASSYANAVTPQALAFHPSAFTLACVDLPVPSGTDMAERVSDKQLGISLRLIRDYSIKDDQFPCRIDVLYGWACLRPELAVRIMS
jgi:hypothetical protein